MADRSKIEWTESTWNPVRGCSRISSGCSHCYAETFAERWRGIPGHPYEFGFDIRLVPELLDLPLRWKAPRRVFVNSMSDLFHEEVPEAYIQSVFQVMNQASQHTFQVLTKRSSRLRDLASRLCWSENIWQGVTIEHQIYARRANDLRTVPARIRFVSFEPLLGSISIDLAGLDWAIVGGESGPGARPMDPEWARGLRDQCLSQGVPLFFKQWGGVRKKATGRILDGRTWDQYPPLTPSPARG